MIWPGELPNGIVIQRTIRAFFCLAGIVWLLVMQSPLAGDRFSAPGLDGSALAYAAALEILQTGDDPGAALEDSIEILRVDFHEFSAPIDPMAAPKGRLAASKTPRGRELSPPLLV